MTIAEDLKVRGKKARQVNKIIDEFVAAHPVGAPVSYADDRLLFNRILSEILELNGEEVLLYPGAGSDVASISGLNVGKKIFWDTDKKALADARKKDPDIECECVDIHSKWPIEKHSVDVYIDKFISELPSQMNEDYLSEHSFVLYFLVKKMTLPRSIDAPLFRGYSIKKVILDIKLPNEIMERLCEIKSMVGGFGEGFRTKDPELLFQWRVYKVTKSDIGKGPTMGDLDLELLRKAK